jgi:uncharacterized protein YidB (DUF937 family)
MLAIRGSAPRAITTSPDWISCSCCASFSLYAPQPYLAANEIELMIDAEGARFAAPFFHALVQRNNPNSPFLDIANASAVATEKPPSTRQSGIVSEAGAPECPQLSNLGETTMALINQILSALTNANAQGGGVSPTAASPIASVIAQLVGGQSGDLNGLVQKFEAAGLANVVQSWIGTGANLPIHADQLQQALGAEHLSQLAQSAGLNKDQLLQQLSAALPGVIDHLTPGGQIPAAGTLGSILSQFTSKPVP